MTGDVVFFPSRRRRRKREGDGLEGFGGIKALGSNNSLYSLWAFLTPGEDSASHPGSGSRCCSFESSADLE